MSHATRAHKKANPVHVTMKVLDGVPSLRGHQLGTLVCQHFRSLLGRRADFRVVVFCVLSNHVHLIVEAATR